MWRSALCTAEQKIAIRRNCFAARLRLRTCLTGCLTVLPITYSMAQTTAAGPRESRALVLRELGSSSGSQVDSIDLTALQNWTAISAEQVVAVDPRRRIVVRIARRNNRLTLSRFAELPSELSGVGGITTQYDTLVLTDLQRGVRAAFSQNGHMLGPPKPLGPINPVQCGQLMFWQASGSSALLAVPFQTGREYAQQSSLQVPIIQLTSAVRPTRCDTLLLFRPGPFVFSVGDRATATFQPLNDGDVITVAGSFLFVAIRTAARSASRASYHIKRVNLKNRKVESSARSYQPMAVTRRFRDSVRTVALRKLSDVPIAHSDLVSSIERGLFMPRYAPPVSEVVASSTGALVVRREITLPWSDYDLHSSALAFRGNFRLEATERIVAFGHGRAWVLKTSLPHPRLRVFEVAACEATAAGGLSSVTHDRKTHTC